MKKAPKFLALVVALLALNAAEVRGQSALDGFDPNANGTVLVVVVQTDGKILIGGNFTTLAPQGGAPVDRHYIARLNPDGTLDTAFNPNAGSTVESIAVQADGKILVGGVFGSIGGQLRNHIARLDATTGLADSFDPNPNNNGVVPITIQADGKILVGGDFTNIGGQTRHGIARLDATTGLADSFNPNSNSDVRSIVLQTDGKILVSGNFTNIGGQARNHIARLDATTGLADLFNPNANSAVNCIAVQADGKILAGGLFSSIGGQTRNRIARLDSTTGLADSFDPNGNSIVFSIVVQTDGKVLAGGSFDSIGGQTRNGIARLDATTGLADSFDPNAHDLVWTVAVQPDGKILVGGDFTTVAPNGGATVTRNRIARLETDGRLDQTLNLNIDSLLAPRDVLGIAVQPDGKILIAGAFEGVLGVTHHYIARLNTDGTLDTAFNPEAEDVVYAIAVQADGKILVGGRFSGIGGQPRNFLARLDATTGLADSFAPGADQAVFGIVVQADGKILVCGYFQNIGGQPRSSIARLDPTTALADSFDPQGINIESMAMQADGKVLVGGQFMFIGGQTRNYIARLDPPMGLPDSFDPNASGVVHSVVVQAGGKILAGGNFTSIGEQTRNHIARLDPTTGLADSFDPNANDVVRSITVQADGKILAGGQFTAIGGQTRHQIARLDPTTGLPDSFDPNANQFGIVYSIAVQADGKILVGGSFTTLGGQPRFLFARLSNDIAALQNLAVAQTTVTWTRGGSSPQFTRVTFEYSTDNSSYIPLGNGTAAGSNWTLAGLSLPTGLNFYIRARGHQNSGFGSESIMESVRNAFLAGPISTPTPTPTGTPTPTATSTATPTATAVPSVTPTPTPTPSPTPTPTPTPTPRPATLANISTRLRVETGGNAMIGGFIITGTQPKTVIVRGIGPSLPVPGALADPIIEVHGSSGELLATNDNWRDGLYAKQVASTLPPTNDLESALWGILNPGSYTVVLRGKNGATGIGLVEVYDLDRTVDSRLANISTRGFVQSGANVMIGGFIVVTQPTRVIIRAIGPSLTQFGVPNVLANPQLELHDASSLIGRNDDWQTTQLGGIITSDQIAEIQNSQLAPTNSAESAIIATLQPGSYTAIVRGVNNTMGNALVEVYALQ